MINKPADAAIMSLGRLLRPATIAVIGGSWAEAVILSCKEIGFKGEIWPLHPVKDEIAGLPVYRDPDDLPSPPDAVFLGVNRKSSIDLIRKLAAMGAGGVVAFASGFAEVGDGRDIQDELVMAAGSMPVLGPNCYGMINYLDGALLWPDVHGGKIVDKGVAIITQSSNLAINLTMQRGGLPIGYMLTLGNQAMIGMAELIRVVAADERVTAIGLHIEGIGDARDFAAAVHEAKRQGKPVVALKAGASAAAQEVTFSHTASLAGGAAATSAFFEALGVGEAVSIESLLQALAILHCYGEVDAASLLTMSCSGGEAALMADAAERAGVAMPALDAGTAARISETVNPLVTVSNPFDYHTFDWGNRKNLEATFTAAMSADNVSMVALIIDFPRPALGRSEAWQWAIEALLAARDATGARAAVLASMAEGLPEDRAEWLMERGIPALRGLDTAVLALRASVSASVSRDLVVPSGLERGASSDDLPETLDEVRGKALLAAYGLAIPRGEVVRDRTAAIEAAGSRRVVMKAVSSGLSHKTEMGAVRLDIVGAEAVASAYDALAAISPEVLVEEMIDDAVAELIVGVGRDAVVGLYLVLGSGGVMAELDRDTVTLMLPASAGRIEMALASLKVSKLVEGWRGAPRGDREAVIAAVLAIQEAALDYEAVLDDLEVNPLMVRPSGAVAVDVLIRMRDQDA